jgi:cellulose synthase (UDP-forming)
MLNQKGIDILQNKKVFKWVDYPIFAFLSVLSMIAIVNFFRYCFSLNDLFTFPFYYSTLTLILIIILINNQGRWLLLLFMRKPTPMAIKSDWKVAAVTSIVPHAESIEMLEATLKALISLNYPHDTWVLDEEDNEAVKKLCISFGANHFSRKNYPQYQANSGIFQSHSKHGNYNAWLYSIAFDRYDIITAFDPDHVPQKNFLTTVLGYFEDPSIGYVQAAQVYYNQKASFIARGAAEETYAYYSSVQMASYGMGYPIVVGCHNTHRVTALQQVGGFAPHDADDLLITLFYRDKGWKGVYVPEILARGLTPVDWNGYLTQQRRWARSVLDVKLRHYPKMSNNLTFKARLMGLLHGLNYLHKSFIILLGLILLMYMLVMEISPMAFSYPTLSKLLILYGVLQICEFYRQRFYLDPKNEWGLHWRVAILQYAKWPYFLIAFLDVILNRQISYSLTKKIKSKRRSLMLFYPHIITIVFVLAAWIGGGLAGRIANPILHFCAAIIVITSLVLILTENLKFPDPYSKAVFKTALSNQ